MRHALLIISAVACVFVASNCVAQAGDCASALAQVKKTALTEDYAKFDQTAGEGWRRLGESKSCFPEAAELIAFYLANKPDLRPSQRVNLSFHAGQLYAFAGDDDEAVTRFRAAVVNPSAPPEFKWSEYVLATIAFLQEDYEALIKNRDAIAAAAGYSPNQSNLRIVDLLLANFGHSYKDALRSGQ
jgi:hypothetical protein